MQWQFFSLISEDTHCTRQVSCTYRIARLIDWGYPLHQSDAVLYQLLIFEISLVVALSSVLPSHLLHSLLIPNRPWQSIGLDFMGPLPKSNNFDYLLVVIDRLTSQVHLVPTTITVTARGIVWLILKEVVRLHGIPESTVSDPDTKFTSIFWRELHRLIGSKLLMSTVFHP